MAILVMHEKFDAYLAKVIEFIMKSYGLIKFLVYKRKFNDFSILIYKKKTKKMKNEKFQ